MSLILKYRNVFICVGATALMALAFIFLHIPENYLPKGLTVLSPGRVFPDAREGEPNTIRFTITDDMLSVGDYRPFIHLNHQVGKLFQGGTLREEMRVEGDRGLTRLSLYVWPPVDPGDYSFEVSSKYGRYMKTVYPVYFGEFSPMYNSLRRVSTVKFAFLGLMFIAFTAISAYILLYLRRAEFVACYFPLALFLLFSGLYVAMDTYSINKIFNDLSKSDWTLSTTASFSFWLHFSMYLVPLPLFLFAMLRAKGWAWKMLVFMTMYFAMLLIVGTFCNRASIMFLPSFGDYYGWGMIVGSAVLLYWSITQREQDGFIYPYFFGLLLIASVFDYACYKLCLPVEDNRILKSFLMVFCTLWAMETIRRMFTTRHQIRLQREITEIVTANVLENYEKLDSHMREMRKIKHDLVNHYQSVLALYSQNEHKKALQYLEKLSETFAEGTRQGIRNILVDSIIYNKLAQAQNIRVETDITIPRGLPFEDSDVCSLLVNILDNALEGCMRCDKPWIKLKIFTAGNKLFIRCKNSKNGPVIMKNGVIQTSKIPRQGHGYGLSIISGVVEKYSGMLLVDYDDESFSVDIAMPMNDS